MYTTNFSIHPSIYRNLPFDLTKAFAPVTQTSSVPMMIIVHPTVPAHSLKELIALGAEPVGNTPEQFAAHIQSEIAKWTKVVKATGMELQPW